MRAAKLNTVNERFRVYANVYAFLYLLRKILLILYICKVASLVDVEITAADISSSHRIKLKMDLSKFPPPIIAKFLSRDTRDEVYRARGKLRDFSTKDLTNLGRLEVNPIFVSESLTEMNKKLFKSALSLWKYFPTKEYEQSSSPSEIRSSTC